MLKYLLDMFQQGGTPPKTMKNEYIIKTNNEMADFISCQFLIGVVSVKNH